ncbi:LysM peptidoglycan-binding domain-containing protein [Ruegeria sp. MALMAid1280]|uniref:LysM peptidoglycan-binding domain-containing protein n=1 Tax=Ruegeria sp. MALMAid1280 TaxID=3411634 RepID=UPI003B9E41C0
MPEFAKATITFLKGRRSGESVPVLFNPSEYNLEMSSNFSATSLPGLNNPVLQFVHGEAQVLTMDLLFDTYTDRGGEDVTGLTGDFAQALLIDGDLHAAPPVLFAWGSFSFQAVTEKLSQRFTMFLDDGTPVRASLSVTFKQYQPIQEQLRNPRRNSADKSTRHEFSSDETLWALAARHYGEPRFWRLIARNNQISDPRRVPSGTVLILPPLEDSDADSARP